LQGELQSAQNEVASLKQQLSTLKISLEQEHARLLAAKQQEAD
jgi:hypothetical protein